MAESSLVEELILRRRSGHRPSTALTSAALCTEQGGKLKGWVCKFWQMRFLFYQTFLGIRQKINFL